MYFCFKNSELSLHICLILLKKSCDENKTNNNLKKKCRNFKKNQKAKNKSRLSENFFGRYEQTWSNFSKTSTEEILCTP